ncbi:MAG: putative CocE/NonD family hydrolase [Polaribacter sp.]|jgi:putative CocE/NonD family hydrolase
MTRAISISRLIFATQTPTMLRAALFTFFLFSFLFAQAQYKDPKGYVASDVNQESPAKYDWEKNAKYKKYTRDSYYLVMRDSVKIAVDVYVPKVKKGHHGKFPTILHQWRYWRDFGLKWPYKWLSKAPNGPLGKFFKELISNGYVLVSVDSRGSGASTGSRAHPWTQEERDDMTEIIDHIVAQSWSDGIIGVAGVSYSGTTSEFAAIQKHSAVKAVVNMYSLFDVYTDNAFPGGIHNIGFTQVWGEANEALDRNELPPKAGKAKKLVKGVSIPKKFFDGRSAEGVFEQAQEDHKKNTNVNDGALTIVYRDDKAQSKAAVSSDVFSPHTYWKDQDASGAAIYNWSGWFDGSYNDAAVKRYMTLTNPKNKLILGPWEHGGSFNAGHTNSGRSGFDHIGEVLRFFDHHLKGWKTGVTKEKPVHYFTMVEEKWKASDTWPPSNTEYRPVYFEEGNSLAWRNNFSTHQAKKSALKLWGDSLNRLKSTGMNKVLKKLEGEGKVSPADEKKLAAYREIDAEYQRVLSELNAEAPQVKKWRDNKGGADIYQVDTTTTMGRYVKFRSVSGELKTPHTYLNRTEADTLLLVYDSDQLEQDLEVTGHALVDIFLSSSTTDAQVFAYLEDVDENGKVQYVTEGELRALHRKVSNEKAPYSQIGPYHSYLKEDALPLKPGEVAEMKFSMLPISYLFKKGHRVRIAIAGADADQFRNMTNDEPLYTIHRSFKYPSRVELPVVTKQL